MHANPQTSYVNLAQVMFVVLTVLTSTIPAQADEIEAKPFDFPYQVMVYDLPISENGIAYRLYVRPPLRPAAPEEKSACFYFLDALRNFVPAAAMSSNYEYFNYIPSAFYIGVGYQNEADGIPREANRTRDYTPTAFAPPNDQHYLAGNPVDYVGSGGGADFWQVMENEIIPFIEQKFDVDSQERVLIGKSMSGLGAIEALLTKPGLFNRYVIISPSIWWDDWLYDRTDRSVMKLVAETADTVYPTETRVYFAVGDDEERMGLVTDLYVLANALTVRRNENLKVFLDVLPGERHEGVYPAAFMRGIVGVYADEENRKPSGSMVKW